MKSLILIDRRMQEYKRKKELVVHTVPIMQPPRPPSGAPPATLFPPDRRVIDIPVCCAVHGGQLAVQRYVRSGAYSFEYVGGVIVESIQQHQYKSENVVALPVEFRHVREQCPCCGMWTPLGRVGAVRCTCGKDVCFGKTTVTASGAYFRCFCPAEGWVEIVSGGGFGIIPSR